MQLLRSDVWGLMRRLPWSFANLITILNIDAIIVNICRELTESYFFRILLNETVFL